MTKVINKLNGTRLNEIILLNKKLLVGPKKESLNSSNNKGGSLLVYIKKKLQHSSSLSDSEVRDKNMALNFRIVLINTIYSILLFKLYK
jgi:hypothetical protein